MFMFPRSPLSLFLQLFAGEVLLDSIHSQGDVPVGEGAMYFTPYTDAEEIKLLYEVHHMRRFRATALLCHLGTQPSRL